MKNNLEQLNTLLQSIEGIIWEADITMERFTFISDHVQHITGFSATDWLTWPGFWKTCIHPEDQQVIENYSALKNRNVKNCVFEYRIIRSDGQITWIKDNVSIIRRPDGEYLLRGIMIDNTVAETLRGLQQLERDVLRLNSDLIVPLQDVLLNYLRGLETLFPQMQCSIHRIKNNRLMSGISSSLPAEYINALTDLQIGNSEGSCGAAAATGQRVIVSDIATDYRWLKYRTLALDYQLSACWSNPIIGSEGEVIATLAMYYQKTRSPSEEELQVMERATALLQIIIENRQKTETITEANLLMLQSQELAHFGNWRWDLQHDIISWSPALYEIYGIDSKNFKLTFTSYLERLHPEDQDRVRQIIENILQSKQDIEFEERIIRPNGEQRYLHSWAKLKLDAQEIPIEMIGACLDITEKVVQMQAIKQQTQQLLEIAWMQSHVVRSPLTKIISLVEIIKDTPDGDPEKSKLLEYLLAAAYDMDEQIKSINKKTEQAN
ncbi:MULTISPECIES: PAS domain-containing protein [unclassified Pedobacter]|uniref:PAS domain-containing protein n=1 Tax=unclassified Pedobacter TaxID=2628915 RepID=UPI000D353B99|nr:MULTISPECIES: PAS domain-containing protein [unclassified Pedobacter]PTS98788.1 hypothetical protein DBR11_13940 [Pedobacter sp. HMWF019]HWW40508.1 PAS domain-containing protein [Pedobacter sp.]